ncbi:DMT family transporter [Bdellovibrio sp. HCB209]|uniref:DMT family transporter n=1 Tax=Bdellovibrio sp. HCB209 TaxID=3394354 RepID=UPI0039B68327
MYIHHKRCAVVFGRYLWIFLLLGLVWGTNFLFMKISLQSIGPVQVAWMRVVFGMIPIMVFGLITKSVKLSYSKHWIHFFILSVLSIVIPYMGFIKGTQILKSGAAGAVSGVIPLITALFVVAFIPQEKMNAKKFIGVVLGAVGVALIANLDRVFVNSSDQAQYGCAYMILGACGYASASVYTIRFIAPLKINPVALTCYQTFFASLILTVVVPFEGMSAILENVPALLSVTLGLGVLGTGLAFIIYFYLIEKLGAVTAASVFYIPPIVAVIIGIVWAGESMGILQALGAVLILIGVWISKYPNGKVVSGK